MGPVSTGLGEVFHYVVRLKGVDISSLPKERQIEKLTELRTIHDWVIRPQLRTVSAAVEDAFGFAEINVVSFPDLYAGKIVAALDRQHPRDLYDVKLLYANEGLTDALFRTFLVYIACSGRPPHELLAPNLSDLDRPFLREFKGMTSTPVPLSDLVETRERLIADIKVRLDEKTKTFLLSLHDCEPDFDIIGYPDAANLPAVRWKLINLQNRSDSNS